MVSKAKMYKIKNWRKLLPKTSYTFKELVTYMKKDIFKKNYYELKTGINVSRLNKLGKYEKHNCISFRIAINYDIQLMLDEYDENCYIHDVKKDKTVKKLSKRNTFMFLQNLEDKIKDIRYSDSFKATMDIVKDMYNKK